MKRTTTSWGISALEVVRKRNLAKCCTGVLWHASAGKVSALGPPARFLATTIDNPLTESATGILDRLLHTDSPTGFEPDGATGMVLSVSAGMARVSLSGA
eukprot:1093687-Amphidinium_carterae.1